MQRSINFEFSVQGEYLNLINRDDEFDLKIRKQLFSTLLRQSIP